MSIKKNPESVEMYLETILKLSQKKPEVHSIDIANEMGFSKPSVSVAMKNLREEELITMDELNHIHLTDKGKKIAEEDACRIEHFISDETFSAIKRHASEKLNGQF